MNKKIYIYSFLAVACWILFFFFFLSVNHRSNRIIQTCQFIRDRIYLDNNKLLQWMMDCRNKSSENKYRHLQQSLAEQINLANEILDQLSISHLKVYDQEKNSQIWDDWGLENGIVSKFIDGQLIVTEVINHSEAQEKGIHVGDLVLSFNSRDPLPSDLNSQGGEVKIKRKNKIYYFALEPRKLQYDVQMTARILKDEIGFLKVPSFKSAYFSHEKLIQISEKLKKTKKLILDLRGNSGGSFVAGLRLLSLFFCQPVIVGQIERPKFKNLPVRYLMDSLDDSQQIELLNSSSVLKLETFKNYPCFSGQVNLIVDADTASTAELVATALVEIKNAKIYGAGTSGQLLVGVWYNLEEIWLEKVKVTIPEAIYISKNKHSIEGVGVSVDKVIYDQLAHYEKGQDSWLEQVVQYVSK